MAEDIEEIIRLRKAGATTAAIAASQGIKEARVTYLLWKNRVVLDSAQRSKNCTDYDQAKIMELRRSGLTIKQVAAQIGCSLDIVKRAQREANFKCDKDVALRNLREGIKAIPKEVRDGITRKSHSAEANAIRAKKLTEKYLDPKMRAKQSVSVRAAFERRGAYSKYTFQQILDGANASNLQILDEHPLDSPWKMSKLLSCKCHCGNVFKAPPFALIYGHTKSCGCIKSGYEMELLKFFKEEGFSAEAGNLIYNSKKIIVPLQLDFYVPERNLAVEFCGLFYHSQFGLKTDRPFTYHWSKYDQCQKRGITLVTIFSDEWLDHPDACKEALRHYLNRGTSVSTADNTKIELCSQERADSFFKTHSIQRPLQGMFLGLTNSTDELEALVCFSVSDTGLFINSFCAKRVSVSNFQKLLGHLQKLHPGLVISVRSDNRWPNGELYSSSGFLLEDELPPVWQYTRSDKFRFEHSELQTLEGETEFDAMRRLKWGKIWDCGSKLWMLK